jgi:hypothetical protein
VNADAEASSRKPHGRGRGVHRQAERATGHRQQPADPATRQRVAGDQHLVRSGHHDEQQGRDRERRHATSLNPEDPSVQWFFSK